MNRGIFFGLVLAVYALPVAGCGGDDDDDDGGDDNGNGGTSGTGMNVMCEPGAGGADGACLNETDCPLVENGDARAAAQDCGEDCQLDDDPATCAVGCIMAEGVTQACSICYATLVGCAAENCLAECGSAAATEECNLCQIESGCRSAFDDCSGLVTVPPS